MPLLMLAETAGGVFAGLGAANVDRDVRQGGTAQQPAGILKAANRLAAESICAYRADGIEGLDAARTKGVRIHEGDARLAAATDAFVAADTATISDQFTRPFKLADVDARIATFRALIDKWNGLAAEISAWRMGIGWSGFAGTRSSRTSIRPRMEWTEPRHQRDARPAPRA